ncbi:Hsp20/alpha crystallin family protein [Acuticoccus mangrovi]|uniref:Hsp20/alpha crystallin family protein n=1 Tax=Acuticoccus mangrovi TaxID=2796142 RepID=A0A934IQ26_9HYPH|nr:Hsp20/alpha crystallin family protein [Acuticoccus mangrovi]MBJ3776601.1 Hsp20/alpha crystallin family protein [Acuticoccus mangrovi]
MNLPFLRKHAEASPTDANPFVSLQREVERVFSDFHRGSPGVSFDWPKVAVPLMDIVEKDGRIEMTAELPGLEDKDVEIEVNENVLTIKGEKKTEREEKQDDNCFLSERAYGTFTRMIELPEGVDSDAVKATMAKGILTITVPKPAETPKPEAKKISIEGSA